MRALLLLECSLLKNTFFEILRSPLRLTLWFVYIGTLLIAGSLRIHATSSMHNSLHLLTPQLACSFGGAFLAVFGGTIVYHALGNVRAFHAPIEALLTCNAGISSRIIIAWLQITKLLSMSTRWIWTIALNFIIFLPNH